MPDGPVDFVLPTDPQSLKDLAVDCAHQFFVDKVIPPPVKALGDFRSNWITPATPYLNRLVSVFNLLNAVAKSGDNDAIRLAAEQLQSVLSDIDSSLPTPTLAEFARLWEAVLASSRRLVAEIFKAVLVTYDLDAASAQLRNVTKDLSKGTEYGHRCTAFLNTFTTELNRLRAGQAVDPTGVDLASQRPPTPQVDTPMQSATRQSPSANAPVRRSHWRSTTVIVLIIAATVLVPYITSHSSHSVRSVAPRPRSPVATTTSLSPTTTVSPTTAALNALTGWGATVTAWNATHEQDPDYDGMPAYGPLVATPEGPTPQYIDVQLSGNRVSEFIESIPEGSSLAEAKALILPNLPPDAVAQSFLIDTTGSPDGQSCAFWNFISATMATDANDGFTGAIEVELAYDDSAGAPFWEPNNINTLSFVEGLATSTDVC